MQRLNVKRIRMMILFIVTIQGFAFAASLKQIDDAHVVQLPSSGKVVVAG